MKIPLSVQIADASEIIALLRADPERARRADGSIEEAGARIRSLESAVATLKWLAAHEVLVKSAIALVREEAGSLIDALGVHPGDVQINRLPRNP